MKKEEFLKAMDFRHACKVFDDTKKIPAEELNFILEVGRKSPSSFGMEPWKFVVIQNQEMKEKIRPVCWNQPQITTCSDLVIILARIEDVKVESGTPLKRFARRPMPQEKKDFYIQLYANHLKDTFSSDENIYSWTARQCYIAIGNMMTAAASIGIDSCPIEGFEKENLEEILQLDTTKYQVAMVLPLGYRINEQSEQLRLSFDEVVEFIK
ncbi:NAD(P)H-dependent oxidoreductase [Malaciobacter mytili LMG 24559]|uniref:NAD(P)H-dependent oxidoreductase n=1 Tax=Malaciobacter mytili LMG 24559 TaxID=1032238 RepID=A0AAX2AFE1_9BACT|nr:NAD(P)H-dependent oxidoreductase [Malaciobacter mytili]AXH14922.1 nitroreductase [Malaciobacter mytili LMG 24559]RXK14865.1 NAD(P)H-dependent oxidoreductase [Malaciobacter mytili LMG 24559]